MNVIFKCFNHKEETPSLHVDMVDGKYYCFSCGVEGFLLQNIEVMKMLIDHLQNINIFLSTRKSNNKLQ